MQILDNIFQTEVYNWITAIFIISFATPRFSVDNFIQILKMNFRFGTVMLRVRFKENVKIRYFDEFLLTHSLRQKKNHLEFLFQFFFSVELIRNSFFCTSFIKNRQLGEL